MGQPSVLTSSKKIATLLHQFACARLSRPRLTGSCPDFSATFTTMTFDHSSLRVKESSALNGSSMSGTWGSFISARHELARCRIAPESCQDAFRQQFSFWHFEALDGFWTGEAPTQ
jgi:hypothetical protein